MTAHSTHRPAEPTLLGALRDWQIADDPWSEHHAAAISTASIVLRGIVSALAEQGDRDALRVWDALKGADGVNDTRLIVGAEFVRLEADARGVPLPSEETGWCPECRRRRVVEEVDPTCTTYQGTHEMQWTATRFVCGHVLESEPRIVGVSPGGEAAAEAMAQDATRRRLDRAAAMQD